VSDYVARPYQGGSDLHSLIQFAQNSTSARLPRASYYHPGDFVCQLYAFDESDDVRLLRNGTAEGAIIACAIFEPPHEFQFAIDATLADHKTLVADVIRWAEHRRALVRNKEEVPLAAESRGSNTLSTSALETDSARIEVLIGNGYALHEGTGFRVARDLTGPLPPVVLPEDAAFRRISDGDAPERAELHRDAWSVWGQSKHTTERYRRLRSAPLYDPELDVVLEFNGQLVSYCVCWLDAANHVGLFEPVGTRPSATRRGFGRIVLHEAFRRLREKGMRTAIVSTGMVNRPAMALYASEGFEMVEREYTYVKPD